ncbi:MAG: AMP-binding protein, partial [Pseudoxanthomonas suwonensis]|nr:AMP-binding protein [Pseudoxanthomonas suwonensis]
MNAQDLYPVADYAQGRFAADARYGEADYQRLYQQSIDDPDAFWAAMAERIDWLRKPTKIRDVNYDADDFRIRWYEDGQLNVSVNCLDRHLATRGDKAAIIFEPDDPDTPAERVSYRELHRRVCKLGNAMRSLGVGKGDRVTIYLPMTVDAVVAMLACARIGAVHMVVFGGFAPHSIADR